MAIIKAKADIYNPDFIKVLQTSLINIIGAEEGKTIFDVYSHTGYAIAQDSDFDGARKALEVLKQATISRGCCDAATSLTRMLIHLQH